jgi:trigger factor
MCGAPLYEYDHIVDYSVTQCHEASNITLLCDTHHTEKTRGLLDRKAVIAADSDPHNLQQGISKRHLMHYSGGECFVELGGGLFSRKYDGPGTVCSVICIDGLNMLGFTMDAGELLLTVNLFDQYGNKVLVIDQNELVYSIQPWDIRFEGNHLTINLGNRDILVRLRFDVPDRVVVEKGQFMHNGVDVVVKEEYAAVVNNKLIVGSNMVDGAQWGLVVGRKPGPGMAFCVCDVPTEYRYSAGAYSVDDRRELDRWFKVQHKEALLRVEEFRKRSNR